MYRFKSSYKQIVYSLRNVILIKLTNINNANNITQPKMLSPKCILTYMGLSKSEKRFLSTIQINKASGLKIPALKIPIQVIKISWFVEILCCLSNIILSEI
jgi:hypothetical protein